MKRLSSRNEALFQQIINLLNLNDINYHQVVLKYDAEYLADIIIKLLWANKKTLDK